MNKIELKNLNIDIEEIEKITDEYGQLHETDCDLNSEDGSFDGCTCAMKSLSNEVVGRLIEYFSHDIFDNEEQRKAGVELYRERFGLKK